MIHFPPRRILVPVDLSGPSFAALETAKDIARRCGSFLDVVYVQGTSFDVPGYYREGAIMALPEIDAIRRQVWQRCSRRVKEGLTDFPASRARVRAVWGQPIEKVQACSRGRSADLIVMGTHGRGGWQRLILGSIAEAVVRRAAVPVLCVPERSGSPRIRRILAPYNMTPYADRALRYALDLAQGLGGSLEVLYVAEDHARRAGMLEELRGRVAPLAGARPGVRVSLRIAAGDARHVIAARAKREGFDLVALSAHRRPFSSDYVIGSTVERLLRHCSAPVLAVPSAGKDNWKEVRLYAGGMPLNEIRIPA